MRRLGWTLLVVLAWSQVCLAAGLELEPAGLAPGQSAVVRVCLPAGPRRAAALFRGREFLLMPGGQDCSAGRAWVGVVAADLGVRPGRYLLKVLDGSRVVDQRGVEVLARDYGLRRITVDPKYLRLSPATLRRHRREMAAQRRVYARLTPRCYWHRPWLRPVPGVVTGPFGRRTLVNGQPRQPHGGVDLRGAEGSPVRAPAAGVVALVQDSYFGGLTLLIDHGLGVISGYRHLSACLVRPGEKVSRGQVIARVGRSGRVTGPHLHFDVHVSGARVDPLAWLQTTRTLAALQAAGE